MWANVKNKENEKEQIILHMWLKFCTHAKNANDENGIVWSYLPNPSARVGYDTRSIF